MGGDAGEPDDEAGGHKMTQKNSASRKASELEALQRFRCPLAPTFRIPGRIGDSTIVVTFLSKCPRKPIRKTLMAS